MNISRSLALKGLGTLGATAAAGLGLGLENSPLRNALGLGLSSSGDEIKGNLEKIDASLSLPEGCKLNENDFASPKTCSLNSEQLKSINFENKGSKEVNINGGAVTLVISKGEEDFYPGGYKFTFKTTNDVSGPVSLKGGADVEFKIKNGEEGQWFLERAWTIETMAEKVGLNCTANSNECSVVEGKFNVYDGSDKKLTNSKRANGDGKIKFERENAGYNQGFKFSIEGGNINLPPDGSDITKLEKYETYEIKEHEGVWYFSRKNNALKGKSRLLGLPEDCNIPAGDEKVECNLNSEQLKNINFEGKNNMEVNQEITAKLAIKKIENEGADDQSFGNEKLKFTFRPSESIVVDGGSESIIKLLKGTDPEFKIKEGGNKLTLERAWTKENLENFTAGVFTMSFWESDCWNITNASSINAMDENEELNELEFKDESLTITVEEDQEGYGQGFKFKFNKEVSLGENKINLSADDYFEIRTKVFGEDKRYFSKKKIT